MWGLRPPSHTVGMGRLGRPWSHSDCRAHLRDMDTQLPISGLDPLLSIEDLADYLGVPVSTIYDWRVDGKGPCGVKVGRHVKFIQRDVVAWIESQREVRSGQQSGR